VLLVAVRTAVTRWQPGALRNDQGGSPLDPQDVGVGISAGQMGCRRRVREWLTCRSSARVQVMWSPSGPQIAFMW
jgi:hypothetical protein